ncbi:MAG: hypothetical protein WAM82_26875 [Thermoanaerobaculia bacterium]
MATNLEYRVLPAEPLDPPSFTVEASPWGLGSLLMSVALIITIMIEPPANPTASLKIFFSLEIAAIILSILVYSARKKAQIDAKTAAWMRRKIAEHGNKASELTRRARQIMESFYDGLGSLPGQLKEADNFLSKAEEEFHERAYSPFWDNIEHAALRLGAFNANLTRLETEVGSYKRLLNGELHNFPPLVIRSNDIPNPARETERLRQLVRMGHLSARDACAHIKLSRRWRPTPGLQRTATAYCAVPAAEAHRVGRLAV